MVLDGILLPGLRRRSPGGVGQAFEVAADQVPFTWTRVLPLEGDTPIEFMS
jgi:hypothetical protein